MAGQLLPLLIASAAITVALCEGAVQIVLQKSLNIIS